MKRKFLVYTISILTVSIVGIFGGCSRMNPSIESENKVITPTNRPAPEIKNVFPWGYITIKEYEDSTNNNMAMGRGVRVIIWSDKAGLSVENSTADVIKNRVALFINNKRVSNDKLHIADGLIPGSGPFYLSWTPSLRIGLQTAIFKIENDKGEILEYQWQFEVTK